MAETLDPLPSVDPRADMPPDPPEDRPPPFGGFGRPRDREDIGSNVGAVADLNSCIQKYRVRDDTYVGLTRKKPDNYDGKPARGYVGRFHVSDYAGADDLMDFIEKNFGGHEWELRFARAKDSGGQEYLRVFTIQIASSPILKKKEDIPSSQNGQQQVVNTTPEIIQTAIGAMQSHIDRLEKARANPGTDIGTDIVKEAMKQAADTARDARAELSQMRSTQMSAGNGSMELVKSLSDSSADKILAANNAWAAERSRLLSDFEREKKGIEDTWKAQVARVQDRLDDEVRRGREAAEKASDKAADAATRAKDERDRLLTDHQRALDRLVDDHRREIDSIRTEAKFRESQAENLKSTFEFQKQTEIASVKSMYELQIRGTEQRLTAAEARATSLEQQRDGYLKDLMLERGKPQPDALTQMRTSVGVFKDLAGSFGYKTEAEDPAPPQKSEFAETLNALKDSTILDKGAAILGKITDALKPAAAAAPAQQQQPNIYAVPVNPQTGLPLIPAAVTMQTAVPIRPVNSPPPAAQPAAAAPAQPSAQPAQPEQPAAAPAQPASTTVHPGATTATPAAPQNEGDFLKMVAAGLEIEMANDKAPAATAKELIGAFPLGMLKSYMALGPEGFAGKIEEVSPSSPLITAKGQTFIGNLFKAVKAELAKG